MFYVLATIGICQCHLIGQRSDSNFPRQKENREVSLVKNFLFGQHTQLVSEMKRFSTLDG